MRHLNRDFISLFCGAGGFDLGFIQEGFSCKGAYDIDPLAVDVHRQNLKSPVQQQDLSENSIDFSPHLNVDVVLAGPPCQGFSTAGKRNVDDPRNHMLLIAGRIAIKILPTVFIAENVAGVLLGDHSKYWEALREMLSSAGYIVEDILCDANKFGVPQKRKRIVMIAWNNKRIIKIKLKNKNGGVLRDAFRNIEGVEGHNIHLIAQKSKIALIAKHILPGQKLCDVRDGPRSIHSWDIPEVFGYTTQEEKRILHMFLRQRRQNRLRKSGDADPVLCSSITREYGKPSNSIIKRLIEKNYIRKIGNRYDLARAFNGKYRRLRWDIPSLTVDTRFGDPKYFLHPQENRGFTIREAARLQGFPDSFLFWGSEREQFRLIGNAVPPPLSRCLAKFIRVSLIN